MRNHHLICRLCECPVVDGSVQASEVDKDKFAEWCLNFLGSELTDELKQREVICNSCVLDAEMLMQSCTVFKCEEDIVERFKWWPNSTGDEQSTIESVAEEKITKSQQEEEEIVKIQVADITENSLHKEIAAIPKDESLRSATSAVKENLGKKKSKPKKVGGGYTRDCNLTDELAAVMGTDKMARHEVVRKMWKIIKEKNLFDPENRQFAFCNDQLLPVFGVQRFRTFGMMKYLKKHFVD